MSYQNEFGEGKRYASDEMRRIWSPFTKQRNMRLLWTELGREQAKSGVIPARAVRAMERHIDDIDPDRVREHEKIKRHDVIAARLHFEEVAKGAEGKIGVDTTSMDPLDNAEHLQQLQ